MTSENSDELDDRTAEIPEGEVFLVSAFEGDYCSHLPLRSPGGWSVAKLEEAARLWTEWETRAHRREALAAGLAAKEAWIAKNPEGSPPQGWSVASWRPYLSPEDLAALPSVRELPTPERFVELVLIAVHGFKRAKLSEVCL